MRRVTSVSLGARSGNLTAEATFDGVPFSITREGTDGDLDQAVRRISELDGQVDAIGLGGIDRWLVAGGRRYEVRDAARMAAAARRTPVVDGSGLKHTLERRTVQALQESGECDFRGKRVLLVCAVDRFGLAEALEAAGAETIYGDLIYGLGVPVPLRSLSVLNSLARLVLPLQTRLPIRWVYPTGKKQETFQRRSPRFYEWAEVIAGDFHMIRRFLPDRVEGKVILTNSVRSHHIQLLRERGAKAVITTTPEFGGQSFGTNVMEGVLVSLLSRPPEQITPDEYLQTLARLGWKPAVTTLVDTPRGR